MPPINSRYLALETLAQLTKSKTPLPIVFQEVCEHHSPLASDRSLAMNLIYGVLRQRQYLDILLAKLCRMPVNKLHLYVRQGLYVGLYQIVFLDRIPHSAAVNETVNGIKTAAVPKRLHGFVNGVLRNAIRRLDSLPQPDTSPSSEPPVLNHPQWLTRRWENSFGREEMLACCAYNNSQQPLVLRINSLKISRDEYLDLLNENKISAAPGSYASDGVVLADYHGPVTQLPGYTDGLFHVQGEAAQLASLLLLPIVQGGRYLDGCAGLGGKTAHLLQLLAPPSAELVAVEPEHHRQQKLLSNLEKHLSPEHFQLFRGRLQDYARRAPMQFHGILIDAPCSGTGVIGRQPDIRWRRDVEDISRYASIQSDLLDLAGSLLLPGGVLVYATCSLEPEENQHTVMKFLHKHREFSLTDPAPYLPGSAAPLIREGYFQPRPSDRLDGFFAARLVHKSSDD